MIAPTSGPIDLGDGVSVEFTLRDGDLIGWCAPGAPTLRRSRHLLPKFLAARDAFVRAHGVSLRSMRT